MAKGISWSDSQAAGRRLDPRGWKTIMESRLGKPVQWSMWNGQGLMMKYSFQLNKGLWDLRPYYVRKAVPTLRTQHIVG